MMQASRTAAPRFVPVDIAAVLAFVALSALVLNPIFRSLSAATFLGFGCLLIVSNIHHSAYLFARWWYLLLLPTYCLLSTLWSQYPDLTLRYSLQLALTLAVAIVIAGRVGAPTLLRMLFVVYAIGVVLSIAIGHRPMGSAWFGIFGSKNAFAAHVAVFALVSVAVLFDRNSPFILRLGGLGGAVISPPLLVLAQSAGAIMMVVPCIGIILGVMLTERLTGMQKVFLTVCALIGAAAFALFLMMNGETLLAEILDSSGKDPTLTGRTDLWSIGLSFIAERPLQGLGYRAFWVTGFAPAEQLWAMFKVPSGAGFNFHNTYISNAVEIGLLGLALQVFIIYGGAILMAMYALARPTAENAFLLGMQALVILRSFIEVEVFFEFSVRSILAVATFVYAAHGLAMLMRRAPSSVPRRQPSPPAVDPGPGLAAAGE